MHPLLIWNNFLRAEELEYLLSRVYSSDDPASAFGTQLVDDKEEDDRDSTEVDNQCSDDNNDRIALSPEVAALVASALAAKSDGEAVTKNRLRTSHFLREVWWRDGIGRTVFEAIVARAGLRLGLPPASAEAPQIVCYPGGASYFRVHHDSGRLDASGASVELHRDHFGAARIASVCANGGRGGGNRGKY